MTRILQENLNTTRLDLKASQLQLKNKRILSPFIMKEVNRSCLLDPWSLLQLPVVPVIAIQLSCLLQAGLLAKKAVEACLHVKPYIRTSLSPGGGMVTHYLGSSGVLPYLSKLGFEIVGYGCSTCVGNTAPLSEAVLNAVKQALTLLARTFT
ncbi:iron-responsive element-binding protein 2-like isoform X1 [Callithrix jacchus]